MTFTSTSYPVEIVPELWLQFHLTFRSDLESSAFGQLARFASNWLLYAYVYAINGLPKPMVLDASHGYFASACVLA